MREAVDFRRSAGIESGVAIISVVIATYRRGAILRRTLPTVLEQDYPADKYEVIIVMDGPDQATSYWLRHLPIPVPIRIIEQPHCGLAAARNTGIRESIGARVLFLDDDLVCDPRLVGRHAAIAADESAIAFGPVLVSAESPQTIASKWVGRAAELRRVRLSEHGPDWPKDIAVCANYSAPRQLLLTCGGFDESFVGACEEFDLGIRLRKLGAEFRYLPDAMTHEIYVKGARDLVLGDCVARGSNEVRLCRKHPEYRTVSVPAHFNQGNRVLRALRQLTVRAPLSPEPVLSAGFRVAEVLSAIRPLESAAHRLLEFRRGIALFRSAVRTAGSWDNFRQEFAMTLPILRYRHLALSHRDSNSDSASSLRRFEQQMNWLARNRYRPVTLSQWRDWCCYGNPLPPRPVMLTFDECCVCLTELAFPALKGHGFGAVVLLADRLTAQAGKRENALPCGVHCVMAREQIGQWALHGIEFTPSRVGLAEFGAPEVHSMMGGGADAVGVIPDARVASPAPDAGKFRDDVRVTEYGADRVIFGVESGLNSLGTDPAVLKRSTVQPTDSLFEFSMRVRFGWNPLDDLRQSIGNRAGRTALLRAINRFATRRQAVG